MKRVLLATAALLVAGCAGAESDGITVFAAASLTDAFRDLAGDDVELTFAASSQLVAQLDAGADADVLATADEATMADVTDHAIVFARNRLAIVVEAGNPLGIAALDDLADDDLLLALCAPEVPCGRLGARALEQARIDREPTTYGENARAVVTAVELGEVDAALAYVTDVQDGVEAVAITPPLEAVYPIVALTDAGRDFVDLVLSAEGQAVLGEHGFLAP